MGKPDKQKKIAEMKAAIEMLEESKRKVLENTKIDDAKKKESVEQIDMAIQDNYDALRITYGVSKEDLAKVKYNQVSQEYIDKYNNRLEKKGLTDEMLHKKELDNAMVVVGDENKASTRTTRRVSRKKTTELIDDKIERLENEDELMKMSMIPKEEIKEQKRRRRKEQNDEPIETESSVIVDVPNKDDKPVKEREKSSTTVDAEEEVEIKSKENNRVLEKQGKEVAKYDFDLSGIPSYVQYDILPLPSNGECYPHKKNRIPVAYLTAADENIIASPNMYRDGKILDVILERKILDKSIDVRELCKGDRDAIILWLRSTGYGPDFPIIARNPETDKSYSISVKLNTFKYYPFNLKGDKDGYFDYVTENGDVIKFKYLSIKDDEDIREMLLGMTTDAEKINLTKYVNMLESQLNSSISVNEEDRKYLKDCIDDMRDVVNIKDMDLDVSKMFVNAVTLNMTMYTMAVNGNYDRDFIKNYVENMRAKDALRYRSFVNDNTPGVNLKITVNIPQSDGGGSFTTFLGFDDYVFTNI